MTQKEIDEIQKRNQEKLQAVIDDLVAHGEADAPFFYVIPADFKIQMPEGLGGLYYDMNSKKIVKVSKG
jgi:hypothetical protein